MEDDFFKGLDKEPTSSRKISDKPLTAEEVKARTHMMNGGEAVEEIIACPKCGGTGRRVYGYVNFRAYPCSMCKQTGKVTRKRIARVEAAKKARVTAAANLAKRVDAFRKGHQAEIDFLMQNASWSDFYKAMLNNIDTYGSLTERQLASVRAGMEKSKERLAKREADLPQLDVSRIEAMFDTAKASGLKRLAFRALDGLKITQAGDTGANPGALYVKENDQYAGKIVGGKFKATRQASASVLPRLQAIAADPLKEAVLYGKQTGSCCCCGRELTDPQSVEMGIGPICATKWGI